MGFGAWFRRKAAGRPEQMPLEKLRATPEAVPLPTAPTQQSQGSSQRRPTGLCICGCNGIPLTSLPGGSINYELYRACPARLERKRTGHYRDDNGNIKEWRSKATRWREEQERRKQIKDEKNALKIKQKLEKQVKAEAEEAERDKNGLPALSRKEAIRRCLETYHGNVCKNGHNGLRYSFNGQCVECRKSNKKLRDAMKRGAFPRSLTEAEKLEISNIYLEAKRLTEESGVQYHVDHIKPLSKGGEHHPDNLQIITAEENLRKGAKWQDPASGRYRNQGVGWRETI